MGEPGGKPTLIIQRITERSSAIGPPLILHRKITVPGECGKFDGLYQRLAAHMGTDPSSIRLALKRL